MSLLFLLAVACSSARRDHTPVSKDSDLDYPGGDTAGGDTSGRVPDTDTDTATQEEEACILDVAPSGAWAGAATCTDLDFEGFDLLLERDFEGMVYSEPIAMPLSDGVTWVIATSSWVNLSLIDIAAGSETLFEDVQIDSQGVGAGRSQDGSAALFAIAEHDSPRTYLTVVDETGRVKGVSENTPYPWGPSVADVDFDGTPEFFSDGVVVGDDARVLFSASTNGSSEFVTVARLLADDEVTALGSAGIWRVVAGELSAWDGLSEPPANYHQHPHAVPVRVQGETAIVGVSGFELFVAGLDGVIEWAIPTTDNDGGNDDTVMALGDVTADGNPEACIGAFGDIEVVDLAERRVLWRTPNNRYFGSTGGCAMADLDGDGRYEVIQYGELGLYVRDGATGEVLASRDDIGTVWYDMPAIIADVDDDGSAEIVVSGGYAADGDLVDHQDHLFVFGPASGRWARTRPVWNQMAYDVTSIRDDGIINSFPFNNWDTYNSFRAQPAHDGEHPDLVIAGTDACADVCAEGGTIRLAVQVSNPGSVDAFAGSIVRLYSWTEATGLRVVAETTLEDTVPAGESAEAVVLEVPYEDWGDQRMLEVVGTHDDECDWVNNREEIAIPDPCSEAR